MELEKGWVCRLERGVKNYYYRDRLQPLVNVPKSIKDNIECEISRVEELAERRKREAERGLRETGRRETLAERRLREAEQEEVLAERRLREAEREGALVEGPRYTREPIGRTGTVRVSERVPAAGTIATTRPSLSLSLARKKREDANKALLAYARGDLKSLFQYLKDQGADAFEEAAKISEGLGEEEYAEFFREFIVD